jgi:DNA invertase Pin-like site-specific DNA recombinase
MNIGYARTSTLEQKYGYESQIEELEDIGCEKIFKEQVSSVSKREELDSALDFAREGDVFVVTKLDRLARNVSHLLKISQYLDEKRVSLRVLNLGIDTSTATGKMMLTMLGAVAEFERSMLLERQREGIARAKAEGKYKGRKATAREKSGRICELKSQGVGASEISRMLNISRASVYRILNAEMN